MEVVSADVILQQFQSPKLNDAKRELLPERMNSVEIKIWKIAKVQKNVKLNVI